MHEKEKAARQWDAPYICALIVSVVMAAFVLAQGMPYFHYGEGESASLFGYIAMPSDYPNLEKHLSGLIEGYSINGIVGICILLQVMAIAGAVLIWRFRDNVAVMALTGATGLIGLIGYGSNAALRLGGDVRVLYYLMFAVMLVLSVYSILAKVAPAVKERRGKVADERVPIRHG